MMQANTGVRFETKDPLLSQLVKQAEEKCRLNIKNFGGDPVLVEGGGYEKIWLETQPMGGAMYASRDFATGLNNSLMFMRHQRADGRIPGSIAVIDGKVVPQFNKFQGFCFPEPALDLYYLGGKDAEYLAEKITGLRIFEDEEGKMNRSLLDRGGKILAVSQFTLLGDARRGKRPSFSRAAAPQEAVRLYRYFIDCVNRHGIETEEGIFQAEMLVRIYNDGPVTILLDSKKTF